MTKSSFKVYLIGHIKQLHKQKQLSAKTEQKTNQFKQIEFTLVEIYQCDSVER